MDGDERAAAQNIAGAAGINPLAIGTYSLGYPLENARASHDRIATCAYRSSTSACPKRCAEEKYGSLNGSGLVGEPYNVPSTATRGC